MSSLVDHASRFDEDVALVRSASVGFRKIIAAAKRMLGPHERGVRHQNIYWDEYLNQRERLMVHQRAIWLCKLFLLSLMRLVLATFRAFLSGAVWLLHYFSHRALTRSCSLAESARLLDKGMAGVGWAKLRTLVPALPFAVISLLAVGMVLTAKPLTDVELVLPILPETQGPTTTTSAATRGVLHEAADASIALPSVPPGLAGGSLSSETVPGHLPPLANDSASMIQLTPGTLRTLETTTGMSDRAPADVTEPRPQPATGATSSISPTTASKPAEVVEAAPARLSPVPDRTELNSESPKHRQKSSANRGRGRDFVPHANW